MRFRHCVVAVVLVGFLASCGSGGVEPKAWTKSVCAALIDRRLEIQGATSQTSQGRAAAQEPGDYRALLVTMLGDQAKASDVARQQVSDAGFPDVEEGEQIAGQLVMSLTKARDAYTAARGTVEGMQIERVGDFYTELGTVMDKLKSDVLAAEFDPATLKEEELRESFKSVPVCMPFWEYAR